MTNKIYHNPRCGKSRCAVQYFEEKGIEFETIKYLETPLRKKEIQDLLKKLKLQPIDIVRVKEKIWMENFKSKKLSDDEILEALVEHPILIERPIVVIGDKAVIARPIENVDKIL
ncbi:arsenate reductase (glutaredoxin) [Flavobacterium sp. NST-5]|uniref:Arsenate reductase (Glutaredoxin) n=1 Tax=Flavobacterium ichthyis TaxID=2698827 RepID=A0ABW9Z7S5_9FLAO|nr:arsenate reductase (glutaredoxin) [Flavobacterium ichthyis]NBL64160.1 arsenate reductase (glutaredoxin) [Flavobacterium ichthyis]